MGARGRAVSLCPYTTLFRSGVLSRTLIVWLAVLLLPQASVAVQVRTCATGQVPLLVSTKLSAGLGSQASVAVGVAKLGAAGHSIVLGAGSAPITGGDRKSVV